jgi:methylenetetrahydrofolate dehydrogenase (NADP+)/methenyltetrahydrofolate cyclohydrolase
MKLIDGKLLAEKIKDKIALEIVGFNGPRPGLAIILVGDRPDSVLYVNLKEKQGLTVGIDTHVYRCAEIISQDELLATINFLNNDKMVDAILVQLPLPEHLNADIIVNAINPDKDIDGFTKENMRRLMSDENLPTGRQENIGLMPPVYGVILAMLESIDCELNNKKINLLVNSDIFEDNLEEILKRQGAEIIANTKEADIVITAQGKAKSLTADMVKDDVVIIDIGISHDANNKVVGDVDAESMKNKPGYLSPVPGGVGPMTIAMAFLNTLITFKKQKNLK